MFNNVGGKIKVFAMVVCWVGIIGSVIGGISMFVVAGETSYYNRTPLILSGIAIIIVGALLSWLGSLFTYGFGELIEQATSINMKLGRSGGAPASPNATVHPAAPSRPASSDPARVAQLRRMLNDGVITEEEFNQAMNK